MPCLASCRAVVAGRYADDRNLNDLIGELCVASDEFARLWAKHPLYSSMRGTKHLNHQRSGSWTWPSTCCTSPTRWATRS